MSTFSYQEKSLYGMLAADLLVYIPYLFYVLHHASTLSRIAATILQLIVAHIVLQSVIAIVSRNRVKDERDRQIAGLGFRNAYFALVSMIILGIGLLWMHAAQGDINPNHMGLHFLSVFFGMVVISELIKIGTQLVSYRRAI